MTPRTSGDVFKRTMPIPTAPRFSIERPFGRAPDSVHRVRAAGISDVHLGTRGANAGALLNFLREYDFETLYIVGDLIDIWSMRRGRYWPQQHNDVVQKVLRKARKGTRIVYIPGNQYEQSRLCRNGSRGLPSQTSQ